MDSDPTKQDRCVSAGRDTLLTWAVGMVPVFAGGVVAVNKSVPSFAKMNWRVKALACSVATVALASYKGERAMIDCVQEYEERSKAKARKQRQMREEAAAAAAAAGALTLQQ